MKLIKECKAKSDKTTKLNLTTYNAVSFEILPHNILNTKKGVIRCSDLKDCTDEEILEGLKDKGVIKLDKIPAFGDGFWKQTETFILIFQSPTLQNISGWVTIGWLCHRLFLI